MPPNKSFQIFTVKSRQKKTTFLSFVILLLSLTNGNNSCTAQSKAETQNWIIEKLNKLKSKKYIITKSRDEYGISVVSRTEYSPDFVEIKDSILTIKYTHSVYSKIYPETTETKTVFGIYIYSAPINYVSSIGMSGLPQNTTNQTNTGDIYLYLYFSTNCVNERSHNGQNRKVNFIPLHIDPYAEEDLANRLLKALNHLKTFYPKPKEVF
ncbi:hypothetical protein [Lacibacter sp. H407]|uniref:hypothetical protein n=1 Tax=Lacibacter sp. H407 TaxID=3133423 RepID=UPI0030C4DC1B